MKNTKQLLFSYGTLQLEKVQKETYGRLLYGHKDSLKNYSIASLEITDLDVLRKSGKRYHPVAVRTENSNDCIEGVIFEITKQELLQTDGYEVSDYRRILETFDSGKQAWIYVQRGTSK